MSIAAMFESVKRYGYVADAKEYRDVDVHLANGTVYTRRQLCGSDETEENVKKRVFGKEFKGYSGAKAIEKLLQEKQGFIQGAFSRNDIGDIDVVYGEVTDPKTHKGYGLAHIFDKHPEITPRIISEIIDKGTLEKTHNGYNLTFGRYRVGINNGYKENGEYVTTDNWIVTSFKINKEKVNSTIAYAADFTSDTNRSENLFTDEIIIHTAPKVKSIAELWEEIRNPGKTI